MGIETGELDRRVTFQRSVETANELNEPVLAWVDLMTVWARVERVSDGERIRAQQVGAWITARFVVRWSRQAATLSAVDRVAFDGRRFDISATKEIGRREFIEITAAAGADEGRP